MKREGYYDSLRSLEAEEVSIRGALRRGVSEVLPDVRGLEEEMKKRYPVL